MGSLQAFHDIRVLDFTHVLSGPFASFQMGLLGAEVIKVESPGEGDVVRCAGGAERLRRSGMGLAFQAQASNKKSIVLDLETEVGRRDAIALATDADVFIENYRTGALSSKGLGHEALSEVNPSLIYCSITGFGQVGPLAQFTAYDNVIQATSGLMSLTGTSDTRPGMVGAPLLDYGTGYAAAFAVAAALLRRARTGLGQYIDLAMHDVALGMMGAIVNRHLNGEIFVPKDEHGEVNAAYGRYQTNDGQIMIGAYSVAQSARLWRLLGEEEEARETEAITTDQLPSRHENQRRILTLRMAEDTTMAWVERLQAAGVPAGPVQSIEEALSMPQMSLRGIIRSIQNDESNPDTPKRVPGAAYVCSQDGPCVVSPPPRLGEHTDEVLSRLRESGSGWGGSKVEVNLAEMQT